MKVARLKSGAPKDFLSGVRQSLQKEPGGAQGSIAVGATRGSLHLDIGLAWVFKYLKTTLFLIPKNDRKCYGICHICCKGQRLEE